MASVRMSPVKCARPGRPSHGRSATTIFAEAAVGVQLHGFWSPPEAITDVKLKLHLHTKSFVKPVQGFFLVRKPINWSWKCVGLWTCTLQQAPKSLLQIHPAEHLSVSYSLNNKILKNDRERRIEILQEQNVQNISWQGECFDLEPWGPRDQQA